jgi:RNA polymerase sigma-70 factor (ECF subfamily)
VASVLEDSDLAEMAGSDEDALVRTVVAAELRQHVRAALGALPAEQRQAVVMHHLEGMPVAEIAQAMGVRPGTVMSRLARAREALRGRLSRYVEAEDDG